MWRNIPDRFRLTREGTNGAVFDEVKGHYPGIVFGELMPLISGAYRATEHKVMPSERYQYSAIYFAMPALHRMLPGGESVGDWLKKRKQRARKST